MTPTGPGPQTGDPGPETSGPGPQTSGPGPQTSDPGPQTSDPGGSVPARLEVGHIARAHGLRGQVVVELVTNRTERVAPASVLVDLSGRRFEVAAAAPHGAVGGRQRWVVTFVGVTSREGAEALRGTVLTGDRIADDDALWVHELIGASLVDVEGAALGRVVSVQANPASDLLVTDSGALVPLVFVVAREPGQLTIDAPPGLFDL